MSRKTTQTATTDRVQQLLNALNGIDGIDFVEDAWIEKAPANYGVVELTGEIQNDYADGKKTAQAWNLRITIYVTGGSHHWISAVQDVLTRAGLPYTAPQREYLNDIKKVMWVWNLRTKMNGPLTIEGTPQPARGGRF